MEGKERKRADDLPAGAVEQVREMLNRPRSSADFSPAARYAVQRLADYAEQEHEQREKAETRFCGERRKTRQSVFLEQWPEAELVDGIIDVKPCRLVAAFRLGQECHKTFCYDCRRKFWMQEVE